MLWCDNFKLFIIYLFLYFLMYNRVWCWIWSWPTCLYAHLSAQDNECNIIYISLFINDGGGLYIYIYIYIWDLYVYIHFCWYNLFVMLLMLIFVIYVSSMMYTINYVLFGWMIGTVQTYCLSLSPISTVVDCYI